MRLFILGATGGTGKHLVDLALQRGHHVTAFVRSPQKLPRHERLTIVEGDPRQSGPSAVFPYFIWWVYRCADLDGVTDTA